MQSILKVYCRLLLTLVALFAITGFSFAQISGSVKDATNEPIIGASIIVKGSTVGSISDANGNFSINTTNGTLLEISSIGYSKTEMAASQGMVVVLNDNAQNIDDVVVVGYGTQKKANLTGAVSTVDVNKTLTNKPFTDVGKGLQGVVPGLTVTYGSGDISKTPTFNIRGIASLNGTSAPLILVDGVVVPDITFVNPEDIESMSVLKDASSTSIFGARAAAGVIMITTKSGKKESKFTISYSDNFSWSTPTVIPQYPKDPIAEINAEVASYARRGAAWDMFGMKAPELIAGIQKWQKNYANAPRNGNQMVYGEDFEVVGAQPYFYKLWDPVKEMYQTQFQQNHNLQVAGGTDKLSYFLSGSYSSQEGILKINPNSLDKYNLTAGVNADVKKWLNIDSKFMMRQYEYEYPYSYVDPYLYMWRWGAFFPYGQYTDPNSKESYWFRHAPGFLANASKSTFKQNTLNASVAVTIKFTDYLNLRSEFSYLRIGGTRHEAGGYITMWDFWGAATAPPSVNLNRALTGAGIDETDYTSSVNNQITSNTYLTFNKTIQEKHNIKVLAGLNLEKGDFVQHYSKGYGILNKDLPEIPVLSNNQPPVITSTAANFKPDHTWWAVAGYFARVNYEYDNKYLIELNGRYDGSSNFPVSGRWAFFPSGSIGWRIMQESFMESVKATEILTDWKIRASYGTIGNQDVGSNLFLSTMASGQNNWITGSSKTTYYGIPQVVSNSLTWERINTLDIGTDIRLWKNYIGVTFDWFQRDNVGMIASSTTLPSTFGASASKTNVGNLRTRGWELALDFNYPVTPDLRLYANVALSDYITKVSKWGGNDANSMATGYYSGQTVGEIWGFETAGYYKDAADVTNSPSQTGLQSDNFIFGPGDIKYADLDGNNKIDAGKLTKDDHGDLKVIGNTTPRYQYSFRLGGEWKGIDLELFFQGVGKRDIWASGQTAIPGWQPSYGIFQEHQMDFWTPDKTDAFYPNPYQGNNVSNLAGQQYWSGRYVNGTTVGGNSANNFYPQTKYLLNLAYLRLKSLTVGYTLPKMWTQKIHIDKFRVYFEAMNLFTFSNTQIPIDPETTDFASNANAGYGVVSPFTKTFSFGFQVQF